MSSESGMEEQSMSKQQTGENEVEARKVVKDMIKGKTASGPFGGSSLSQHRRASSPLGSPDIPKEMHKRKSVMDSMIDSFVEKTPEPYT